MSTLREAVNAKCRDCIFDPHAPGTWRQQVHACTATECPLHPVRPLSESPLSEETLRAYHNYVAESGVGSV